LVRRLAVRNGISKSPASGGLVETLLAMNGAGAHFNGHHGDAQTNVVKNGSRVDK